MILPVEISRNRDVVWFFSCVSRIQVNFACPAFALDSLSVLFADERITLKVFSFDFLLLSGA